MKTIAGFMIPSIFIIVILWQFSVEACNHNKGGFMNLKTGLGVVAALALSGVMITGCCLPSSLSSKIGDEVGKSVEKNVNKAVKDSTGIDTTKTKEATGEDLKSVPRYPDSTRTLYIKGEPVGGNISISITYETKDAASKVVAWYKDKMAGLGWTVTLSIAAQDGGELISYKKGETETTATVNVTTANGTTNIGIMYNGAESGA